MVKNVSFWRHPFTAEDPLVKKWCNAKFLQTWSYEETNPSTSCGEYIFRIFIFILGWTIPLKDTKYFDNWLFDLIKRIKT